MPVRTFIAIPLPGSAKIIEFHKRLSAMESGKGLRPVAPRNMHLTLRFIGDVEESRLPGVYAAAEEAAKGFEIFPLKIVGTGAFPKKEYIKVIWLGVHEFAAGRMGELARRLNEQLAQRGFGKDRFTAHLTVARAKFLRNRNAVIALMDEYSDTIFAEFTADRILVIKSDLTSKGPIYTILKEIPLGDEVGKSDEVRKSDENGNSEGTGG